MQIANTVASKALVAVVATAMLFSAFAAPAKAQTAEELQKTINDLMAQIAKLQGGTTTTTGSSASVCPFTWTRDLKTGATGADVKVLQQFLNANADTRVAATGVGSTGMETEYFGPATAAAVSKFQVMHRADVLTPAGLTNPTGFFGPGTRAKANALCVKSTSTTTDDEDDEEETGELSGEASLKTYEMDDADDSDVQEGDEDVEIAVLTVEFEDGDAEISRLDIDLGTTTADAWDLFETITVWVDGDMVAEVAADDEDDYLDDNEIRVSGLDIVAMEDEELDITIAATIQDGIDDLGDVEVDVVAMRWFDADGVAETEAGADGSATVTIEEAGEGEALKFSISSNNPDATDIIVDTDSKTNDVTVLEYDIEAEEGDIDLDTLALTVVTTGSNYEDIVDDMTIEIDGQTFDVDEVTAATTTSATVTFDIDGDVTIEEDEEVAVVVNVDFKSQASNYSNGDTIKVSAAVSATEAEGADDVDDFNGSAVGQQHTIVAEGIVLPVDGVTTTAESTGDNDQTGEFTIEFEVTAVEGDFYITDNVFTSTSSAADGVAYSVEVGTGTTTVSGVLSSTADEDTDGVYTVREGETETFTLTVTVDTSATTQARVTLTEVNYSTDEDGVSATMAAYTPTPASDFRTAYKNINAN